HVVSQFDTYDSLLNAIVAESGDEVKNPATGEVVGIAPAGTPEEMEQAIARARDAQKDWAKLGEEKRNELLLAPADAIEADAEPLAELLSREQGKPLNGPNPHFEVGACSAWLRAPASFESPDHTVVEDG